MPDDDTFCVHSAAIDLPPPKLATATRDCCCFQNLLLLRPELLPRPVLTTASRACHRVQSLPPLPELATTSKAYRRLQSLPLPPELAATSKAWWARLDAGIVLPPDRSTTRSSCTARSEFRPDLPMRPHAPRTPLSKKQQAGARGGHPVEYIANPRPGLPEGRGANLDLTWLRVNLDLTCP